MPATVILDPVAGPVVVARLSEWHAAGRFLHAAPQPDDPPIKMIGYTLRGEAERLADHVNQQVSIRHQATHPDRLRWRSPAGPSVALVVISLHQCATAIWELLS